MSLDLRGFINKASSTIESSYSAAREVLGDNGIASSLRDSMSFGTSELQGMASGIESMAGGVSGDGISNQLQTLGEEIGGFITGSPINLTDRFSMGSPFSWPADVTQSPYIQIHVVCLADSITMKNSNYNSGATALSTDTVMGQVEDSAVGAFNSGMEWGGKAWDWGKEQFSKLTGKEEKVAAASTTPNEDVTASEMIGISSGGQPPSAASTNPILNKLSLNPAKLYSQKKMRLAQAIVLPMPKSINGGQISANWKTGESLGTLGGVLFDPEVASKVGWDANTAEQIGASTVNAVASYAVDFVVGDDIGQKARHGIANPFVSAILEGTKNRTYDFSWEVILRNANEAQTMKKLIKALRYHASPEFVGDLRTFMRYPSEFELSFMMPGGKPMSGLPLMKRCVCTACDVGFGGTRRWEYLEDEGAGGLPPRFTLTLKFFELLTITKEDIEKGY